MPGAMTRGALLAALALAACGPRPAPRDPTARTLFRDLERQVTVAATTGWGADRLEIEGMIESTLDSVCRVDPLARRSLAGWLEAEIARLGGPVEKAWRERGKDLSRVGDLLVLTRVKLLLARAEELAGDCPFWLEPEHPYRGLRRRRRPPACPGRDGIDDCARSAAARSRRTASC